MKRKKTGYGKIKRKNKKILLMGSVCTAVILSAAGGVLIWKLQEENPSARGVVREYFTLLEEGKYTEMYGLLDAASAQKISGSDFAARIQTIYEGIDASDFCVEMDESEEESGEDTQIVSYELSINTCAGTSVQSNQMLLNKNEEGEYRIQWDSTLIFPSLQDGYTVSVAELPAERGTIYDRNGNVLAAQGTVSQAGLVPGRMTGDKDEAIAEAAGILGISEEYIRNSLEASYVQDDTFVPLKQFSKEDTETEEKLLQIPGVLITDAEERVYPLGEAAGHLTGYVQAITAEELEEKAEEGYTAASVIGRSGLEAAFEEQLRAVNGTAVNILDSQGDIVDVAASVDARDGQDIYVSIDADLQNTAYEQFRDDRGTAAAMNPVTGEVLALVSAPGYDPNEFILGLSDERWDELNNSEDRPLMNRFESTWVPGSTFKGITAAIGVDSNIIDPDANMGYVGLSWQKDESWGDYYVTTLTDYGENVNLENALVYSDNIYFARAALDIGADVMTEYFGKMGFEEEIPFELNLQSSSYDEDGSIDSDIQLADTGYGQGQLLVNPVHLLSMYSMFVNGGNMIAPTLETGLAGGTVWKEQVISVEAAEMVKKDLIQVVENPSGTGASARIEGLTMLGKTGTAEIKESQDDTQGVERGWFICETAGEAQSPAAVVGMVEDVKTKGGSSYVTAKVRNIMAAYQGMQ